MYVRLLIVLACTPFFLVGYFDKKTVSLETKDTSKYEIDSQSKEVLQIF
jgi:hypothetical protein